ncbi:MAG: hypothetical protein JXR76_20560 [Deltaproteobacteria bacterium]|nr:hypothetical protein [Deltaproteobacteria bacterium]
MGLGAVLFLPLLTCFLQVCQRGNALVEALSRQGLETDFCDVEPAPVFGRVVNLEFLGKAPRQSGREGFVERCGRMRVRVVHNDDKFLRVLLSSGLLRASCISRASLSPSSFSFPGGRFLRVNARITYHAAWRLEKTDALPLFLQARQQYLIYF